MSHLFELTDEQYRTLERAAEARGQTPDVLLSALIEELRDPLTQPRYYETEEWFRHLGLTEEQIAESARLALEDGDADS